MPTANNPEQPVNPGMEIEHSAAADTWQWRDTVTDSDVAAIRELVAETGFFSEAEVAIAAELVQERLEKGAASGYEFLVVTSSGRVLGYSCYGEIPCTVGSYDLYWIAVAAETQGQGLGRSLMTETERRIRQRQGRHVYAETSSRPQYERTRTFYERCGYELASLLEDFYAPGDGKATYRKILG